MAELIETKTLDTIVRLTHERDQALAAIERVKDVVRAERQDNTTEGGALRRAYNQGRRDVTTDVRSAIEGHDT